MRIGVYLTANPQKGGIFQFSLTLLKQLANTNLKDTFILFSSPELFKKEKHQLKKKKNWQLVNTSPHSKKPKSKVRIYNLRRLIGSFYDRYLKSLIGYEPVSQNLFFDKYNLDLIIYPVIDNSCYQQKVPFVVWIHDLQHLLNPQFPEVSQKGEWRNREYLHKKTLKKAALIVAESQTGKDQIHKLYHIPKKKVAVLPYLPPPYLTIPNSRLTNKIRNKYRLPKKFIFYPANFWLHKNHQLIIKVLAKLKNKGINISALFVGQSPSQWSEYDHVMKLAKKLAVADRVRHLGYVNNQEMAAFYKSALALVMPTFFGPSNIPPLEAFKLGCPVITSNIKGIREQVCQAAILVDPKNSSELAKAIEKLYYQPQLRKKIIQKAKQKIANWTEKDFRTRLETIIKKAKRKVSHG